MEIPTELAIPISTASEFCQLSRFRIFRNALQIRKWNNNSDMSHNQSDVSASESSYNDSNPSEAQCQKCEKIYDATLFTLHILYFLLHILVLYNAWLESEILLFIFLLIIRATHISASFPIISTKTSCFAGFCDLHCVCCLL